MKAGPDAAPRPFLRDISAVRGQAETIGPLAWETPVPLTG